MEITYHPKGSTTLNFGYVQIVPNGYNGIDKLPVIIFQHGLGEAGEGSQAQLGKVLTNGVPKEAKNGRELPAIIICPQQPLTGPQPGFMTKEGVKEVLDYVRAFPNVDLDRVYYTGLSAGSVATFRALYFYPELITAALPVAIRASQTPNNKLCKGFPVYLISNEGDAPSELTGMLSALQLVGVNLKTDIGPGSAHNSWDRAYSAQSTYDWLFAQNKQVILPPTPIEPVDITTLYDSAIATLKSQVTQLEKLRDRGRIYTK